MTEDQPESIREIAAGVDALIADMGRLMVIVILDQVLFSRNFRGLRRSFAGPWRTFAPRKIDVATPGLGGAPYALPPLKSTAIPTDITDISAKYRRIQVPDIVTV